MSSLNETILQVKAILDNAEVPTVDRYAAILTDSDEVEIVGPINLSEQAAKRISNEL